MADPGTVKNLVTIFAVGNAEKYSFSFALNNEANMEFILTAEDKKKLVQYLRDLADNLDHGRLADIIPQLDCANLDEYDHTCRIKTITRSDGKRILCWGAGAPITLNTCGSFESLPRD